MFVKDMLPEILPRIILCSIQYREDAKETIEFFASKEYDLFAMWLNPGFQDDAQIEDHLSLAKLLLSRGAYLSKRNGKSSPVDRANEIRQFIYGWAKSRNLIKTDFFFTE